MINDHTKFFQNVITFVFQIKAEEENKDMLDELLYSLSYTRGESADYDQTYKAKDLVMVKMKKIHNIA